MSWLPTKCVVVPFDFSDASAAALTTALEFVASTANLRIIHVLQLIMVGEPGMYFESIDNEARIGHAKQAFRKQFSATRFGNLDLSVQFGDPGREIVDFAEHESAGLIIMPSHGRTGLTRLLLGSVAEKVVRLAHCPVLILK